MSDLKHVEGRVVVAIDREGKNWHTFSNGKKIRLERQFDNLNRRQTEPVNGVVISAKNIPEGAQLLMHHNVVHDVNRIFNYATLSGKDEASDVKYYSVREQDCFIWLDEKGEWQPLEGYATALRVFDSYKGILQGIEPTKIKDVLYVTSGDLKGKVVKTIKASDFEVVFQDTNGQEGNIIRFRPNGYEDKINSQNNREPEAIAILLEETKLVSNGELLVGISVSDAKPIKEFVPSTYI
jgi:hypothetical protein